MDLRGKSVIVTGASRGIGRQVAVALGGYGASVAVAARTVDRRRTLPGTVGETVSMIDQAGGVGLAVPCDVTRREDLERLVAVTVERFGRLDVVINNAADMVGEDLEPLVERLLGGTPVPAPEHSPQADTYERWAVQFATNVHAPYYLMLLAAPHMRAHGGGVIVNVSSGAADPVPVDEVLAMSGAQRTARNRSVGYAASKAALNRLTNAAAADLAPEGISVVAVDPGRTQTELVDILGRGRSPETAAAPMSATVEVIVELLRSADPLVDAGRVLRVITP